MKMNQKIHVSLYWQNLGRNMVTFVTCHRIPLVRFPSPTESPRRKLPPMKRAVKWMIVLVGLVGASLTVVTPTLSAFDGGPIPLCNPNNPNCTKGGGR